MELKIKHKTSAWLELIKQSGPGWIQAAVTLGGGTLVSALYLGVIGGYDFLWLQPLAMLCGIIMLSALSYVNLSLPDPALRPFVLVKKYISPMLAWSWLGAAMIANIVFCAAQFALASDAVQGNLRLELPSPYILTGVLAILALGVIYIFSGEGKMARYIDLFIKGLVAVIILSFMVVVIVLFAQKAIPWESFLKGWIPKPSLLFTPNSAYKELINISGEQSSFWTNYIMSEQRSIVIGAFGTAVGINMTFLLPYSQRKKGWNKNNRRLSVIDLLFGLLLPFVIGASSLIIATASQFHAKENSLVNEQAYFNVLDKSLAQSHLGFELLAPTVKEQLRENAPLESKKLSTMLARRSANDLAEALKPFLGQYSQLIFGVGILAMAFSTMLVHMMINGYALSEAFGRPGIRGLFMLGALIPALSGFFSPIVWAGSVKAAVIVPASVIATTLLPIAYLVIFLLMNSRKALGNELIRQRYWINGLMCIAIAAAGFASVWALLGFYHSDNDYQRYFGFIGLASLLFLGLYGTVSFIQRERKVNR